MSGAGERSACASAWRDARGAVAPRRPPFAALMGRASRLARSGRVVTAELVCLGAAAALTAALPQEPDLGEIGRLARASPDLVRFTAPLGLHHVTTSGWFIALVLMAVLSLVFVQVEQWRRVLRMGNRRLAPGRLAAAQYREEIPLTACRALPDSPLFREAGRLGALGSPLFHLGLLVAVVAGLARSLVFSEAVVQLYEGDVLEPDPSAYAAQRGGPLSSPFALHPRLRVEEIQAVRYGSGALSQLRARLRPDGDPAQPVEASINAPGELGVDRLYLTQRHGVAALVERRGAAGVDRRAILLEPWGAGALGSVALDGGVELRFQVGALSPRPGRAEVRVLRGGTLTRLAGMAPGDELRVGPGEVIRLAGLPYWAELRGSHDPTRPVFFAGLVLAVVGVALLFGFVHVESAVFVEGERLVVALRAQRFAPLFAERFEQLCREWRA